MNAQAAVSMMPEHVLAPCPSNATQRNATNATNATLLRLVETPRVPDAPNPVDNDLIATRAVLDQLAAEADAIGAELELTGLTDFADRADWLMSRWSTDRQLAWDRRWAVLDLLPDDRPQRTRTQETLDELDWLLSNGATPWEAADALKRTRGSLSRLAYRHGRPDMGMRMLPEKSGGNA